MFNGRGAGGMSEAQFHNSASALSVREIADLTGAVPHGDAVMDRRIRGIAALDLAGPDDLSFVDSPKYSVQLAGTRAGICLATDRFAAQAPAATAVLVAADAYRAFVLAARQLFPDALRPSTLCESEGVSAGAFVHKAARLESDVTIDPGAVVGPRAEIGAGSVVGAGAVVGPGVRIGRDCSIGAGASLTHALLGDRVIIHPGCRIGQDGFGYAMGPKGHQKIPQIGRVIIQDDVEIGANSTIDRGAIRDTIVGEGTKIDNLVQVGHNVVIGRHCVIVAQTGISGSVTLGDFVVLGARVGINNHVTIGEGAQVAGVSIVYDDVPPGARWGGWPAKAVRTWFREMKTLEQLARRGVRHKPAEE